MGFTSPRFDLYARVFSHIEETTGVKVTRGSVHERIWASHDDFRRDVLTNLVSTAVPLNYFLIGAEREAELRELLQSIDDPQMARLTVIKLLCDWSLDEIAQSETYRQVQSAKAIATRFNDPEAAAAMQQLLEAGSQHRLVSRRELLGSLISGLGLRVRPKLGLSMDEASDLFLSASWALISGAFLNAGAGCSHVFGEVDGKFGGPEDGIPWRVFSLGVKGLLEFLFEGDPMAGENGSDSIALRLTSRANSRSRTNKVQQNKQALNKLCQNRQCLNRHSPRSPVAGQGES